METLSMITSIMMDGSVQIPKQKRKEKRFWSPYLTNCINTNFILGYKIIAELVNWARFNAMFQ